VHIPIAEIALLLRENAKCTFSSLTSIMKIQT